MKHEDLHVSSQHPRQTTSHGRDTEQPRDRAAQPVDITQPLPSAAPGRAQWTGPVDRGEGFGAGRAWAPSPTADPAMAAVNRPACQQPHPRRSLLPRGDQQATWKQQHALEGRRVSFRTRHGAQRSGWVCMWLAFHLIVRR